MISLDPNRGLNLLTIVILVILKLISCRHTAAMCLDINSDGLWMPRFCLHRSRTQRLDCGYHSLPQNRKSLSKSKHMCVVNTTKSLWSDILVLSQCIKQILAKYRPWSQIITEEYRKHFLEFAALWWRLSGIICLIHLDSTWQLQACEGVADKNDLYWFVWYVRTWPKQLHNFHRLSRWKLMSTTGHPNFLHMWSLSAGIHGGNTR